MRIDTLCVRVWIPDARLSAMIAMLCIASSLQAEAGVAHGTPVQARARWWLRAALQIRLN